MIFNFFNFFNFSLQGKGCLYSYLVFQYEYFKSSVDFKLCVDFKIICDSSFTINKTFCKVVKDKNVSYKITDCGEFFWFIGDEFVYMDGGDSLSKISKIQFSENFPKMQASMIIDSIMRFRLGRFDISLVHAAAVSKNGKGVLIPAWKGMGKTALTIKLLKSGYEYLADDRVWVSSRGSIYSYPRYVVLKDSNYHYFPDFMTLIIRVKYRLTKAISLVEWRFSGANLLRKVLYRVFKVKARHFHVQKLLPDIVVASRANLNFTFILYRESVEEPSIQPQEASSVLMAIDSINNYEWDTDLLKLCAARDLLLNSHASWKKEFFQLLNNDKVSLDKAFCTSMCFKAVVPKNPVENDFDEIVERMDEICK